MAKGTIAIGHFSSRIDAGRRKPMGTIVLRASQKFIAAAAWVQVGGIKLRHIVVAALKTERRIGCIRIGRTENASIVDKTGHAGAAILENDAMLVGVDIRKSAAAIPLGNLGPAGASIVGHQHIDAADEHAAVVVGVYCGYQVVPGLSPGKIAHAKSRWIAHLCPGAACIDAGVNAKTVVAVAVAVVKQRIQAVAV